MGKKELNETTPVRYLPQAAPATARNTQNLTDKHKTTFTPKLDEIAQVPLNAVNCQFDVVKVKGHESPLSQIARSEAKRAQADVVLVYVVRHYGCATCRDKAQVLLNFAKQDGKIGFVSVVKDASVHDAELLNYYKDYVQRTPIYTDQAMGIYKAIGGRQLKVWDIMKGLFKTVREGKSKMSGCVSKSDFWTMGCLLFMDSSGRLRSFLYEPTFGGNYSPDEIRSAVASVRLSATK